MAFNVVVTKKDVFGSQRIAYGTFENTAGDSGGSLTTGLDVVDQLYLQHTDTAVVADAPVVNTTATPLPTADGNVTIVTAIDADGMWLAIGK